MSAPPISLSQSDFVGAFSNAGTDPALLWLEPWAEEFELPAGSSVFLRTPVGQPAGWLGSVEQTPDHIVIWMNGGTVQLWIDDMAQDSASAVIPTPGSLSKQMLEIVFPDQPTARLGGAAIGASNPSWWQKIRRIFAI